MFRKIKNFFYDDIAIDLGTANTLIYQKHKGIILNEPSVVAMFKEQDQILAAGNEAKKMLGRTPSHIETVRPLRDGVIANFKATEKMLKHFIGTIYASRIIKPYSNILICVPCNASQVDCRSIKESALMAGARKVFLIEEPVAAAIGVGINIEQAFGSMVVDIGGGTLEIAILSLNGIVYSSSTKVGGDRCDECIINYLKKKFNILIGESTAEFIKKQIGCAYFDEDHDEIKTINVRGRSVATGVPINVIVTNKDLQIALQEPLQQMIKAIEAALDAAPPELVADIIEHGVVLTGGGALLNGLDKFFNKVVQLPIIMAPDPLTCVVRGGGKVLENIHSSYQHTKYLLQED
jgi:rod shape-determining protein MreB